MSNSFATPWIVACSGASMDCRFLCPWNFPGKKTGVGCHFLLQEIFPNQGLKLQNQRKTKQNTQGLNPRLLHWQVDSLPLSHLESASLDVTHTAKSCPSSVACLGGQIPCMGRGWRMGGSDVYRSNFILSCCLSSFVREAFPWGFGPLYGDTVSSFVWSFHPSSFPFSLPPSLPISKNIYWVS